MGYRRQRMRTRVWQHTHESGTASQARDVYKKIFESSNLAADVAKLLLMVGDTAAVLYR